MLRKVYLLFLKNKIKDKCIKKWNVIKECLHIYNKVFVFAYAQHEKIDSEEKSLGYSLSNQHT